MTHK